MAHEKDILIKYFDGKLPEIAKEAEGETFKVAVVAIETRGTNPRHSKLIELGVVQLELQNDPVKVVRALGTNHWFKDPEEELRESYTEVTGIDQAMVQDQDVDNEKFEAILAESSLIISYNAGHTRPVLERYFPQLDSMVFACVRNQVDWTSKKHECRSLSHLCRDYNFWYEGRRASTISTAIVNLLIESESDGILEELIERSGEPLIQVEAQAPYNQRRMLSQERFVWNKQDQIYFRSMGVSTLARVRKNLESRGFEGEITEREQLPACERFK